MPQAIPLQTTIHVPTAVIPVQERPSRCWCCCCSCPFYICAIIVVLVSRQLGVYMQLSISYLIRSYLKCDLSITDYSTQYFLLFVFSTYLSNFCPHQDRTPNPTTLNYFMPPIDTSLDRILLMGY